MFSVCHLWYFKHMLIWATFRGRQRGHNVVSQGKHNNPKKYFFTFLKIFRLHPVPLREVDRSTEPGRRRGRVSSRSTRQRTGLKRWYCSVFSFTLNFNFRISTVSVKGWVGQQSLDSRVQPLLLLSTFFWWSRSRRGRLSWQGAAFNGCLWIMKIPSRFAYFTIPLTTMAAGWMGGIELGKIALGRYGLLLL